MFFKARPRWDFSIDLLTFSIISLFWLDFEVTAKVPCSTRATSIKLTKTLISFFRCFFFVFSLFLFIIAFCFLISSSLLIVPFSIPLKTNKYLRKEGSSNCLKEKQILHSNSSNLYRFPHKLPLKNVILKYNQSILILLLLKIFNSCQI